MILTEFTLILMITLGFSTSILFSKVSLSKLDPGNFGLIYLMGTALVILLEFILFFSLGKTGTGIHFASMIPLVIAAALGTGAYLCAFVGLKSTPAGISNTVFNLQGPLISLLGAVAYYAYPGNFVIIGIMMAIAGLFIMNLKTGKGGGIGSSLPFVLLSVAPLLWAMEWIIFSFGSASNPVLSTLVLYLFITVIFLLANKILGKAPAMGSGSKWFAFYGGAAAGLGNGSYGIFISSYGTSLTGLVTLFSVPVSVLLAVIFLKERYSKYAVIGIATIIAGLAVSLTL